MPELLYDDILSIIGKTCSVLKMFLQYSIKNSRRSGKISYFIVSLLSDGGWF